MLYLGTYSFLDNLIFGFPEYCETLTLARGLFAYIGAKRSRDLNRPVYFKKPALLYALIQENIASMAAINDLVAQIQDEDLRQRIEAELKRVMKHKKFGLVFEDHLPEGLNDGPIYPGLEVVDSVRHAQNDQLWHALIEADNYYALQLLAYLYPGQVDCIYIDPPYNTGARDWKYNNDYVDSADTYRHSKWLSMMKRRLLLAKRLLNPKDSVLIVTIDEKEYLHLGCLLEELFPEARMQMVSSMINPANVARAGEFGRSGEYLFFIMLGTASPQRVRLPREWVSSKGRTHTGNVRWDLLKRSGTNAERKHSQGGFYPIYINNTTNKIEKVGEPLEPGVSVAPIIDGCTALLPIRQNGTEGNWQWATDTFLHRMSQGRVKIGGDANKGYTVYILKDGEYSKITNGEFEIIGHGINNELIVGNNEVDYVMATPGDIWKIASHDATQYGSRLIGNIFLDRRFTFPKSLYAVQDSIRFFVSNKPNALIVDFFAGSGTTLHAVNLLNAEDGGHRRCIMVTNNEVSVEEAKSLTAQGFKPGDAEWERLGIAQYVNWPRSVCSITGTDVNGQPLKGEYLGTDHRQMADGFETNAIFFRLNFLDKNNVALGKQFRELLPLLWMKSGAIGTCPTLEGEAVPDMLVLPNNEFAVLNNEKAFGEFFQQIMENESIRMVYLIVDSDAMYREMAKALTTGAFASRHIKTCQLYRDYLDNFRINIPR